MTAGIIEKRKARMLPTLMPLKLAPPQPRGEILVRPDLQALLAEVRLQPVTLVVAPAGYGKTTLLAQWASTLTYTGSKVCWITLDEGDRDPSLQLAYLVRAFRTHFADVGEQAWRILYSAANLEHNWPLVAGALCSDLQAKLTMPTFLFLDDLHLVANGPITGQLLGYLLRAAPPSLHIVIASRRPINIAPLPRLRTEHALVEVTQHDLSLSRNEARTLLEQNGVQLRTAELERLLAHTEGWALSIQLAARAMVNQSAEQRAGFLQALEAGQQGLGLFDYLASEVLADLPHELLDFLALAALPDQFDAALLTEVLARHNVPGMIAQAQQMGMPLITVEATAASTGVSERQSGAVRREGEEIVTHIEFRFHPLWRELLLRHAQMMLDADAWRKFQHRFGQAQEQRGNLEAALQHFAAAGNIAEIARALHEHAWPLIDTPQRDIIRRWIERLPEAIRIADPELLHMWGWSQCALAPALALKAISEAAAIYRAQGLSQRELRALSDMAALLFWEDRPADFADVCVRALQAAHRTRDAWARGTALASVVALRYSRGQYTAALRMTRYAEAHPRSSFWQWLLALIVSDILIQQGHPAAALASIDVALAIPQIDRDDRMRQALLRQRAFALYQQGDQVEASELALEAHMYLSDYYNDGTIGTSAVSLALLLIEQDRFEEAMTYLTQARAVAHRTGASPLMARVQALEVYGVLRKHSGNRHDYDEQSPEGSDGESDSAFLPARSAATSMINAALNAMHYLDDSEEVAHSLWLRLLLVLVLGECNETARALAAVTNLIEQMRTRGDGLFLVIAHFYRAVLMQRMGDINASRAALRAGWNLAEHQGYTFLPFLPLEVVRTVVVEALQQGLAPRATAAILRRQLSGQATSLLLGLLQSPDPDLRIRAATYLGNLGASTTYAALRTLLKDRHPDVRLAAESALERMVYRPSYRLRLRTLGAFNVWRGNDEIRDRDWRSIKARQLLQLLLVEHGRMLSRERIMDMLWPGLETEAAANNLRVTLSRLTRALEPERPEGASAYYIVQQADTYGFNSESDHDLDSTTFAAAVKRGQRAEQQGQRATAKEAYRQAIQLYGGVFLPDSLYEDWSVVERERLALLFNMAALRLGTLLLEEGQAHEAIGLAWRVIEYDQAQEEAYQLLLQAHISLGERSTALRIYARCVAALRTELGVAPLADTVALYEALRGGEEHST